MISRTIVTFDRASVSQRAWDDFCIAQGLAFRADTGYFAAKGLHAGCQGGRASFFSGSAEKTSRIVASFLYQFGGQVADSRPVLIAAGA